jgi:hypothetical protein
MAYTGKYIAYVRFADGTRQEWNGLRKTQAQWRYNWIGRNINWRNQFGEKEYCEFGWQREWID